MLSNQFGRSLLKQVSRLFPGRSTFVHFLSLVLAGFCGSALLAQDHPAAQAQAPAVGSVRQTTVLASSGRDSLGEYLVGPDDQISISVLESADLSRDVRVSSDGTIGLPLLAERIHVAGLSLTQTEALVKRKYQEGGILNDPNITIILKDLQSKPVTMIGAVRNPGVFQVSGEVRLLRLISMAGGFSVEVGTHVQVISEDGSGSQHMVEVSVQDLRQGHPEANVQVHGGDTVNVLLAGAIYVIGAVNKPGRFLIPGDTGQTTLLNVLALAEDLKRTAKSDHSVLIRKTGKPGEVEQIPVDLRKILAREQPDIAVQPNDVLFVPDSVAKRAFARGLESAIQLATGAILFVH
jgi:polysaccharide export outer membrane protein